MRLMCLLAAHLLQCWSSQCLHPVGDLLVSCFYIASLCKGFFFSLGIPSARSICPSSHCVWSQMPWRSRWIILLPWGFFCMNTLTNSTSSQNLWCRGSISPKPILVLPTYFLNFSIADLGYYEYKGYTSVV